MFSSYNAWCTDLEILLDSLATAVLLLNGAAGQLIYANAAAERILARNDGFYVSGGRLVASLRDSQAAFTHAVTAVAQSYCGSHVSIPTTVAVHRPSGRWPYAVWLAPYSRFSAPRREAESRPAVMMLLSDPEAIPRPPAEILQALYGLTLSEARLVVLLTGGQILSEAAETLHISLNTAKTHLKAVYAKTGACRQAELMRRVLTVLGGGVPPGFNNVGWGCSGIPCRGPSKNGNNRSWGW